MRQRGISSVINIIVFSAICFCQSGLASEITRLQVYEKYSSDTIRRAIASNTNLISYARAEIPMAEWYQSALLQSLLQPGRGQNEYSESDWDKIMKVPSLNDSRFAVPELTQQKLSCQNAMAIDEADDRQRAMAMAEIMLENELNDRDRRENYYNSFLNSLSPAGKVRLQENAGPPLYVRSMSIRESDRVAIAQEIPEYVEWEIVNDCLSILNRDIASVDERLILSEMFDPDDRPIIFRKAIYPEVLPNPDYDGIESLSVPVISSRDPALVYESAILSSDDEDTWRLNQVETAGRIATVESAQLRLLGHGSPYQAILIVHGYHENDCEDLGAVVKEFHADTNTIYVDLYKTSLTPPAGQSVCSTSRHFLYQEALPVYGLPEGVYSVVVNDEHWSTLPIPQLNVLDELVASRVTEPFPASSEFNGQTLFLPAVDMPEQTSRYQNLELPIHEGDSFELVGLEENVLLNGVDNVEIVKHGDLPAQVMIHIEGVYENECMTYGQVSTRFDAEAKTFDITLLQTSNTVDDSVASDCTSSGENFDIIHPLPVFGLLSGTYQVMLNGVNTGEFIFEEPNRNNFLSWRPSVPIPLPQGSTGTDQ